MFIECVKEDEYGKIIDYINILVGVKKIVW